jgi:hypothetical protein
MTSSQALGALCAIYCANQRGRRINASSMARFYGLLSSSLQRDAMVTQALASSNHFFIRQLDGTLGRRR